MDVFYVSTFGKLGHFKILVRKAPSKEEAEKWAKKQLRMRYPGQTNLTLWDDEGMVFPIKHETVIMVYGKI